MSIKCLPGKYLVGGRLHLDVATLALDVGDDGDDEPDQLDWPAPGGALLLAWDTVLQGGGRHVLRPQSGEAASCRADKDQEGQQGRPGEHYFLSDDWREAATILRALTDWVM